jgi:hypothetical protein
MERRDSLLLNGVEQLMIHSRCGADHGVDLGAGSRGCERFPSIKKALAIAGYALPRRVPATPSNDSLSTSTS